MSRTRGCQEASVAGLQLFTCGEKVLEPPWYFNNIGGLKFNAVHGIRPVDHTKPLLVGLRGLWVHGDGAGAARGMSDPDKTSKLDSLQKNKRRLSGQFSKSEGPPARGAEKSHAEIDALQAQVQGLEEELYQVRRRLEQVPREFELLRARLQQSREQLEQAQRQNERVPP